MTKRVPGSSIITVSIGQTIESNPNALKSGKVEQMAKYYVQSGNHKMVMTAADSQAAALWLIHCALKEVLPAYDDPSLTVDERCEIALMHGLLKLDSAVSVNERGFDRTDSEQFEAVEIINAWHQLMSALLKLESDQKLI